MRKWFRSMYEQCILVLSGNQPIPIVGEVGEELMYSALDAGMIVGIQLYIYWINHHMDNDN